MAPRTVYAFRDPRYETGIKIGYGNLLACLHDAQGYAPEGIVNEAHWTVPENRAPRAVESGFHSALLKAGIQPLDVRDGAETRSGQEWFDCTLTDAIMVGRSILGEPGGSTRIKGLRKDKVLSSPSAQGRLVLWILQECLTGRLKLNACSEFKSPTARRRRYSRNGYREIAAWVIEPPISHATNHRLFEIRRHLLARFAADGRAANYGWCREGTTPDHLNAALAEHPELAQWLDLSRRPTGVRASYTGPGSNVPVDELSAFSEHWWR